MHTLVENVHPSLIGDSNWRHRSLPWEQEEPEWKNFSNLYNHYSPEGTLLFARIPMSHFLDSRVWNDCHGWMQHSSTDRKVFPWTCLWEDPVQWLSPQHPGVVPWCSHQTLIWNPTLSDGNLVITTRDIQFLPHPPPETPTVDISVMQTSPKYKLETKS